MRKTLVSTAIVALISFVTAMVMLNLLTNLSKKNRESNKKQIENEIIDDLNSISRNPSVKYDSLPVTNQQKKESIDSSMNNSYKKIDNEILFNVEQAQNYLNKKLNKSVDLLNFHISRLEKLYKIKGLSKETNKILSITIYRLKIEKENLTIPFRSNEENSESEIKNDTLI